MLLTSAIRSAMAISTGNVEMAFVLEFATADPRDDYRYLVSSKAHEEDGRYRLVARIAPNHCDLRDRPRWSRRSPMSAPASCVEAEA